MCIKCEPIQPRARRAQAFTLAEAIVGVAVMTMLFLGLYGGITYGFYEMQLARENLRATQVILEKMEGIRLYTYQQLTNSATFATNFTAQYYPLARSTNSQGTTFYGSISVSAPVSGSA